MNYLGIRFLFCFVLFFGNVSLLISSDCGHSLSDDSNVLNVQEIIDQSSKLCSNITLRGYISIFTQDDIFVIEDDTGYLEVDINGSSIKTLNSMSEGDEVEVTGFIKTKNFSLRNETRPTLVARCIKKIE